MGIHDGHRERMREQFRKYGMDIFTDVQALEFLLFYVSPRKDTNVIAHNLLNTFGNLNGVFMATYEQLVQVEGVGGRAAELIMLVTRLERYIAMQKNSTSFPLCDSAKLIEYFTPIFKNLRNENIYMLMLNNKLEQLNCIKLAEGNAMCAQISPKVILTRAIEHRCSCVALAHNHPIGSSFPSSEDIQFTEKLEYLLKQCGICLIDHIIISPEGGPSICGLGL